MKKILLFLLTVNSISFGRELQPIEFHSGLRGFSYETRKEMKIQTEEMLTLLKENKAQLIDVRFREEFEAWHIGVSKNIPLNELPDRLNELDKHKLIITACPHNDRASIARVFLKLKGYHVRYLSDGLLKTVDYLRGDNAKEFLKQYKNNRK